MRFDVKTGRGRETVGPPGGPTVTVPTSFTIVVTDNPPYDLRFETAWNDDERRLTIREATFTATDDDEPVRMASIIRVAVGDIADRAMEQEVLGERGWEGVVADHPDDDPIRVDALVYLLSVALGSPKPSANVAIARGLSPAIGTQTCRRRPQGRAAPRDRIGQAVGRASEPSRAAASGKRR